MALSWGPLTQSRKGGRWRGRPTPTTRPRPPPHRLRRACSSWSSSLRVPSRIVMPADVRGGRYRPVTPAV